MRDGLSVDRTDTICVWNVRVGEKLIGVVQLNAERSAGRLARKGFDVSPNLLFELSVAEMVHVSGEIIQDWYAWHLTEEPWTTPSPAPNKEM